MKIKKGKLNYDQSGRAYPDNPRLKENWDSIWEYEGKYYKLVGGYGHKEWSRVDVKERELSLEERAKWLQDNKEYDLLVGNLEHDHIREVVEDEAPTKLITLTYKNKTIKSYE